MEGGSYGYIDPEGVAGCGRRKFHGISYFNDGSVRLYDAKPLLELGGVFEPLRDEDFFKSRLTVLNDTAAWDVTGNHDPCACVDLDPIELYETCPVVVDPLETAS